MEQDVALGRKLLAEAAKEDIDGAAMDTAVMAATAAAAVVEERLRKRNDINTLHAAIAAAAEVSAAKAAAEAHHHRHTGEPFPRLVRLRGAYARRVSWRARTRCADAWRRDDTSFADARAAAACGIARGRANPPTGDCSTNSRACPCSSCTAGSSPTSNRKIQARGRDRTRARWMPSMPPPGTRTPPRFPRVGADRAGQKNRDKRKDGAKRYQGLVSDDVVDAPWSRSVSTNSALASTQNEVTNRSTWVLLRDTARDRVPVSSGGGARRRSRRRTPLVTAKTLRTCCT